LTFVSFGQAKENKKENSLFFIEEQNLSTNRINAVVLLLIFGVLQWPCSTTDSIWASEARDPGSIPGKATFYT
jgi:hypothetical protein